MNVVQTRAQELNLFSQNESLEELSSKDMLYITVPFIAAELESNAVAANRAERLARLRKAQVSANVATLSPWKYLKPSPGLPCFLRYFTQVIQYHS